MKKVALIENGRPVAWVFCHIGRELKTTPNKRQALPSRAMFGADDLAYFQRLFPALSFELAEQLDGGAVK